MPWPVEGQTLAQIEKWARAVRGMEPDLVVIAVPPGATVPDEERIPCPWAITLMHVLWDGRVARCAGDTEGEDCVGNAWHESLSELWSRLGSYRQLQLDRRFDEVPERCRECKDWMTGASERTSPTQDPAEKPVHHPRHREQ